MWIFFFISYIILSLFFFNFVDEETKLQGITVIFPNLTVSAYQSPHLSNLSIYLIEESVILKKNQDGIIHTTDYI